MASSQDPSLPASHRTCEPVGAVGGLQVGDARAQSEPLFVGCSGFRPRVDDAPFTVLRQTPHPHRAGGALRGEVRGYTGDDLVWSDDIRQAPSR